MTREDIKRICTIYDNLRNEQYRGAIAYNSDDTLFEHVLANYKTIEPQGLDEAAESLFETIELNEHENIFEDTFKKIFKAGAKWMAGQFEEEAYEEEVQELYQDEDGVHCVVSVGVDYNPGDKVIVQIRKKNE